MPHRLYPMKDDFASHILSKHQRDRYHSRLAADRSFSVHSTVVKLPVWIDAAAALFVNAYDPKHTFGR